MTFNRLKQRYHEATYFGIGKLVRAMNLFRPGKRSPVFSANMLERIESTRVLSISPHPDDDIIALGGTLARHVQAGCNVVSIVLTDGARGTACARKDASLVDVRRAETLEAARVLSLSAVEFWEYPDGAFACTPSVERRLREFIGEYRPEVVYVPFPIDYHRDHLESARMVGNVLQTMKNAPVIRCYECIIPLIPNLLSDITARIELKRRAVACFRTQNAVTDYIHVIVEGLNRHRTYSLMKGAGYAEAFFQCGGVFLRRFSEMMRRI